METLEKLDAMIYERAAKMVRSGRQHPPLVIIQRLDDENLHIVDVSDAMGDDAGKDIVASLIDMFSMHPSVAVVVFLSEAWMAIEKGGYTADTPRPSEHPDRQECVVVSYSLASSKRAMVVHLIRREPGKKPRLERGELRVEDGGETLDGRFFAERRPIH